MEERTGQVKVEDGQAVAAGTVTPEVAKAVVQGMVEAEARVADVVEKVKSNCRVEVFSRVTGFFRPVQEWNKGKVSEYNDRKNYKLNHER